MSKPQARDCIGCAAHCREVVQCLRDVSACLEILAEAHPRKYELIDLIDNLAERLAGIEKALAPTP